MANRLWKFLTTDISELVSLDTVDSTQDAAEAVLGLADVLAQEGPNTQKLASLVSQLDSLLDVLNSPLGKVVGASLPFVSIGTGLLRFYLEKTKEEPTLAQSVALISQAAYLESFKDFAQQHPKVKQWLTITSQRQQVKTITSEIKALGNFELSDRDARLAALHFHQSVLAEVFNEALENRLITLGAKTDTAKRIAELVSRGTDRYIRDAIASADDAVKRLTEWYRVGGDEVFEKYLSIDTYLMEWIATRPNEQVFAEDFSFKDIYVPLKAQPLTTEGKFDNKREPVVLENWAKQMLNDPDQKGTVMFVQGGPGRGKSVFCRMFADWVRRHEHPRWTPILIRLRDISVLRRDFEETLARAIDRDFTKTDSGWLTDRNVNFLFLLDGFDELLMEGRTSEGLDNFLEQVGRFQEQCARNSEKGHRVLITGRTLALQNIETRMPNNLARVDIASMDDDLRKQWFDQWQELLGENEAHIKEILQNRDLPERLEELAREPLLLYLLAAMYRDNELKPEMFEEAEGSQAKVLIYDRTLDWVLTKQRAKDYRRNSQNFTTVSAHDLNPDITELASENLRRILQEAGLCVVQSGMEFAYIKAIEDRLSQDSTAKAFLESAQKRLKTSDTPLRNALAAFYLQEGQRGEGAIEFVHKSFGEFLCAERIAKSLIDWCQLGRNRPYDIPDNEFEWGMYDLFGANSLTVEIVEYLLILLHNNTEFDGHILLSRLKIFYNKWRDGFFVDSEAPTLPQKKMEKINIIQKSRTIGQRQVDIITGLNTLILLLELSKSLKIEDFLISLDLQFDIHQIVGYSRCLGNNGFAGTLGPFLKSDNNVSILRDVNPTTFFLNYKLANTRFSDLFVAQVAQEGEFEEPWDSYLAVSGLNTLALILQNPEIGCVDMSVNQQEDACVTVTSLSHRSAGNVSINDSKNGDYRIAISIKNHNNSDLLIAVNELTKLKQEVQATDALNTSDKEPIVKKIDALQEELQGSSFDQEYTIQLVNKLKQKLDKTTSLVEPMIKIEKLIKKN